VNGRDKTNAAARTEDTVERERAELIERAGGGGAQAGAAARSLLEAFINGDRSSALTDYIARCLSEYLRGGTPIELALHLSAAVPPTLLGAAGEGDRRRAGRGSAARGQSDGAGKRERRPLAREQPEARRNRRQAAWDKGAPEKRSRNRTERRRKAARVADTD
jgi:hypothetical protein